MESTSLLYTSMASASEEKQESSPVPPIHPNPIRAGAEYPGSSHGDPGRIEASPASLSNAPAPAPTSLPPDSSSQIQHPRQLYSPTQHEIDSHPIVQHYSPVRDTFAQDLTSAQEESQVQLSQRQELEEPGTMADKEIKEGDEGSRPGGTVDEVKEQGELAITSKKGNEIKKNADPEDPAVKVSRSGNDVVKRAHELDVEEEGDKHKEAAGEEKTVGDDDEKKDDDEPAEAQENGDAQTGDKRKADDAAEEASTGKGKKAKTAKAAEPKENGEKAAPKKKGRPAKGATNGTSKAKAEPKKKREPKKAATDSGEPRRSGRNRS